MMKKCLLDFAMSFDKQQGEPYLLMFHHNLTDAQLEMLSGMKLFF